jgi:hypothetical protein
MPAWGGRWHLEAGLPVLVHARTRAYGVILETRHHPPPATLLSEWLGRGMARKSLIFRDGLGRHARARA